MDEHDWLAARCGPIRSGAGGSACRTLACGRMLFHGQCRGRWHVDRLKVALARRASGMGTERDGQTFPQMGAGSQTQEESAQLTPTANAEAFRRAIEQRDSAALLQTLAPDVVFH